jgi:hypothetical protein
VYLFGKKDWFYYCEFFSVFYRLISKIAIIEYKEGKFLLRPPFVGALKEKAGNFSVLVFILFMLSSTAYDGFRETTPMYRFYWGHIDNLIRPVLADSSYYVFQTIAILLSPVLFLFLYTICIIFSKLITGSKKSLLSLSISFAYTLIPIAIVYNIAHYYTLLITQGTYLVSLISDPFGWGWNLFGTANINLAYTLGANFVWHSQVAVILTGHIAGVFLAHVVSVKVFDTKKNTLASQLPMLLLMVSYTVIGLWILSQPITSEF